MPATTKKVLRSSQSRSRPQQRPVRSSRATTHRAKVVQREQNLQNTLDPGSEDHYSDEEEDDENDDDVYTDGSVADSSSSIAADVDTAAEGVEGHENSEAEDKESEGEGMDGSDEVEEVESAEERDRDGSNEVEEVESAEEWDRDGAEDEHEDEASEEDQDKRTGRIRATFRHQLPENSGYGFRITHFLVAPDPACKVAPGKDFCGPRRLLQCNRCSEDNVVCHYRLRSRMELNEPFATGCWECSEARVKCHCEFLRLTEVTAQRDTNFHLATSFADPWLACRRPQ